MAELDAFYSELKAAGALTAKVLMALAEGETKEEQPDAVAGGRLLYNDHEYPQLITAAANTLQGDLL